MQDMKTMTEPGEEEKYAHDFFGEPEWKRLLERQWRRWYNSIKVVQWEIASAGVYWINMAQDMDRWQAFLTTVMNLRVSENVGSFSTSWTFRKILRSMQLVIHLAQNSCNWTTISPVFCLYAISDILILGSCKCEL
jgi:hypothetical protein